MSLNWERILELIRLLKPEFYNKLTWAVALGGLALMSTPFWQEVASALLKRQLDLDLVPGGNVPWGFALVVVALCYHVITNSLQKFVQAQQDRRRMALELEHDRRIFAQGTAFASEDDLFGCLSDLWGDHSFQMQELRKLKKFLRYLDKPEKKYLDASIQKGADQFATDLQELIDWVSTRFFVFPEGQVSDNVRLCMQPDWNVDRSASCSSEDIRKYDDLTRELDRRVEAVRKAYKGYRSIVKQRLVI